MCAKYITIMYIIYNIFVVSLNYNNMATFKEILVDDMFKVDVRIVKSNIKWI